VTLTGQKHLKMMYFGHMNHLSLVYVCPILPLEASKTPKFVFSLDDEPIIEANFLRLRSQKSDFRL